MQNIYLKIFLFIFLFYNFSIASEIPDSIAVQQPYIQKKNTILTSIKRFLLCQTYMDDENKAPVDIPMQVTKTTIGQIDKETDWDQESQEYDLSHLPNIVVTGCESPRPPRWSLPGTNTKSPQFSVNPLNLAASFHLNDRPTRRGTNSTEESSGMKNSTNEMLLSTMGICHSTRRLSEAQDLTGSQGPQHSSDGSQD